MGKEAMLPCFVCAKVLQNVFGDLENQPSEGTEFRTYGAYGSTFWDSLDGEELVLNVCDECLAAHKDRLAQHKRYRPVTCDRMVVGRHWVDRPMVAYTGHRDDGDMKIEPEEIGNNLPNVEWVPNADEVERYLLDHREREGGGS